MSSDPRVSVLHPGDKPTRLEFMRRYAAMPELKKAELIEGVVYMGSPVCHTRHGQPHFLLSSWIGFYVAATPGLLASDNSTLFLDEDNVPQPDLLLALPVHAGGWSRITEDGYLDEPPELVIEVAASSVSYDLHQKLAVYRRSGVREDLVHRTDDGAVDWFVLERGHYVPQHPDAQGIQRSLTFPGLWLDTSALLRSDLRALQVALERGLTDPAHAAFAASIAP